MNAPRVSIVVPVFNAQAYLDVLLYSLLNQSESSLEIIAVDDGSTDQSLVILQTAAQQDARITVLAQKNGGVSAARNHGLKHARGRWITFADSDDWLHPDTLKIWCDQAEQSQLDFLVGNGFEFSGNPEITGAPSLYQNQPWGKILSGEEWIIRSVANNEWPHYVWLQLLSRDLVANSNAQFVEGIVHEDILWTLHLALAAQRMGFSQAALYGYRINPESIVRSPSKGAMEARAQSYILVIQRLVTAANKKGRTPELRSALLRHANREGGHFLGLMRKKIVDTDMRRALALEFLKSNLASAMFQGKFEAHQFWRALRCWIVLRRYASAA